MFRIRLHGRGGQGTKTAGRILGRAFFLDGYEVQDAPLYGAERRGAPVAAYVRADSAPIHERGVIVTPDLAVVVDESLLRAPQARVLVGLDAQSALLIYGRSTAQAYRNELGIAGTVWTLPAGENDRFPAVGCVGAAARLVGLGPGALERAVRTELMGFAPESLERSLEHAMRGYEHFGADHGAVRSQPAPSVDSVPPPAWIDLPLELAELSAPTIHAGGTSRAQATGLWRTLRPVVDPALCHHCHWVCGSACPDGVISPDKDAMASIDLAHCKGCMICVRACPWHAIDVVLEHGGAA